MQERVAVFVDGGNFFNGVTGLGMDFYSIDVSAFVKRIVGNRKLIRTYYYTVRPRKDPGTVNYQRQNSFIDRLERTDNFKVRLGRLVGPPGNRKEKGVDIYLAVDMISLAQNNAYDTAILISGDGDFVEVIEKVQSMGKRVENLAFQKRKSDHLLKTCDTFRYIERSDLI